jgi:DNA-binding MarR family transcriptional regulator
VAAKSSTAPAVDATAIAARLRLSATRLARQLRQESSTGLTPSQLSALAAIERHGPITLGALAEVERVAPPSVTRVVGKLEDAGLVKRAVDAADRRVARVSVTSTGANLLAKVRQRKNVWLASRIADLDTGQQRRLADALDVLDTLTADAS